MSVSRHIKIWKNGLDASVAGSKFSLHWPLCVIEKKYNFSESFFG